MRIGKEVERKQWQCLVDIKDLLISTFSLINHLSIDHDRSNSVCDRLLKHDPTTIFAELVFLADKQTRALNRGYHPRDLQARTPIVCAAWCPVGNVHCQALQNAVSGYFVTELNVVGGQIKRLQGNGGRRKIPKQTDLTDKQLKTIGSSSCFFLKSGSRSRFINEIVSQPGWLLHLDFHLKVTWSATSLLLLRLKNRAVKFDPPQPK